MASSQTGYQLPLNALLAYNGNDVAAPAMQSNNLLRLSGSGTTLTVAHSGTNLSFFHPSEGVAVIAAPYQHHGGGGTQFVATHPGEGTTTITAYTASGITTLGSPSTETFLNVNTTPIIYAEVPTEHGGTVFTTNTSMVSSCDTPSISGGSQFSLPSEQHVRSYAELHQALTDLHSLSDDADWKIQTPVYCASLQVAAALAEKNIPKPSVFTHGARSVVFNWSGNDVDLYLTISKSRLSVLVSSTKGIEYRTEFSPDSGEDTNRFLSALRSVRLIAPPETSDTPIGR
jgi:hypothetical protein